MGVLTTLSGVYCGCTHHTERGVLRVYWGCTHHTERGVLRVVVRYDGVVVASVVGDEEGVAAALRQVRSRRVQQVTVEKEPVACRNQSINQVRIRSDTERLCGFPASVARCSHWFQVRDGTPCANCV